MANQYLLPLLLLLNKGYLSCFSKEPDKISKWSVEAQITYRELVVKLLVLYGGVKTFEYSDSGITISFNILKTCYAS
jgi:hypothetical protein